MKTMRAIITGIIIWILGVSAFIVSFYIPVLEDLELQSNLALALSIAPLAWLGAKNYYSKYPSTSGYYLGLIMVAVAIVLDALITVPFLVVPAGGSYVDFFGSSSFWLIALEYFLVVMLYWYYKAKPIAQKSFS